MPRWVAVGYPVLEVLTVAFLFVVASPIGCGWRPGPILLLTWGLILTHLAFWISWITTP